MSGQFGDKVRYHIAGQKPGDGYVLGVMHYAGQQEIILVGDEQAHGMPVHTDWCDILSRGHENKCTALRDRYLKLYGEHWLKPRLRIAENAA